MAHEQKPRETGSARKELRSEMPRLKRLIQRVRKEDPDYLEVCLESLVADTGFQVIPLDEDVDDDDAETESDSDEAEIVDEPADEKSGETVGFPKVRGSAPGVDPTKPIPGPVFEYAVIGLVLQEQLTITKELLIAELAKHDIDVSNQSAVNTRLWKMRADPNNYISFDKGTRSGGVEVTEAGHTRFRQLAGNTSKGLTRPQRVWLSDHRLWFGDPLPEAKIEPFRNPAKGTLTPGGE